MEVQTGVKLSILVHTSDKHHRPFANLSCLGGKHVDLKREACRALHHHYVFFKLFPYPIFAKNVFMQSVFSTFLRCVPLRCICLTAVHC